MIDLHTHLWPHEPGTVLPSYDQLARMCEFATGRGLRLIAITEHCNRFEEVANVALPLWRHDESPVLEAAADRVWAAERGAHLDDYVTLLSTAQDRGLPLLVGLEVDHLPGANEAISELLKAYPFDVLLGSVHWLGAWLFDAYGDDDFAVEWDRRPIDDVWDTYIDAVIEMAWSGTVDVIAHVDVIKVVGHWPLDLAAREGRLCAALAASGVAVELSSAGLRKPASELYPSPTLLRMLREAGVPLTTASDAHQPEHLGYRFGEVYSSLRDLDVTTLSSFTRRHQERHPLD
jgi:histidinol-phosphatase (PHP family)